MLAHNRIRMPVTREAKEITTRSLSLGFSTKRICEIISVRSIAAQSKTRVKGLSDVTASTPSADSTKTPIQLIGLGKLSRATAVTITARQIVTMLSANAHAVPSAMNNGDWEKMFSGLQGGSCRMTGMPACHAKTLTHAINAPPVAVSQANRKSGNANRRTNKTNAVMIRMPTVIMMNMQT